MQIRGGGRFLIQGVGVALLFLSAWWTTIFVFRPPSYILPTPNSVFEAVFLPNQKLLEHTGVTLFESLAGFVLGNFLALAGAIGFQLSSLAKKIVMPLAIALKTTPIVAIAPLLLIWMGPGLYTKVVASALVCFFPMLVGLYEAMSQTPAAMVEYYESLGATKSEQVLRLKLPYAVPELFAALKVSSTLAVVGAVVGEMVSATSGLGYVIIASAYSFQTQVTFAAIILTAACGFLIFGLVALIDILVGATNWRSG